MAPDAMTAEGSDSAHTDIVTFRRVPGIFSCLDSQCVA